MLHEGGMGGEVVVLAVLEDEDAVGLEQAVLEHEVGNGGQLGQCVGRVGEDEVELLVARLEEAEHVAAHEYVVARVELLHALGDEGSVVAVFLHAHHLLAAAREQFERYAARSGEEVEGGGTVEVDVAVEHVEDVLLRKVGGGTGLEGAWHVEVAAFVYSGDDAHGGFWFWFSNIAFIGVITPFGRFVWKLRS